MKTTNFIFELKILIRSKFLFTLSLAGVLLALWWFHYLSPRPENIRFINPDLSTKEVAHSTVNRNQHEGLYWVSFSTRARWAPLSRLRMRTFGCVNSLNTSLGDWTLPSRDNQRCNNHHGFILRDTSASLAKNTDWYIAGITDNQWGEFGIVLEKDWSEFPLAAGMIFLLISLAIALYLKLPLNDVKEKSGVALILCGAFLLRFWLVFIVSPMETTLYSDMIGYFSRAWEIDHGIYNLNQIFQPIGFTLWSLAIRKLGGFELLSWTQVFFSWGIVLVIFLMVRERFGKLPGICSLIIASTHIPQAGFAAIHLAENIYAFLITLILWCLFKTLKNEKLSGFFIIGILLSLAFYFKGNHAFFIPTLALWLLIRERPQFSKGARKVFAMGLGCLTVSIPHLVWTNAHYQKPYLGPTAGALNFVEGKCPTKDNQDSEGNRWMSPLFGITGEREFKRWPRPFTDQSYFWNEGFKCVQNNPEVLITSARYIYYLFWGNHLWPLVHTALNSWYMPWSYFFYYGLLPLSLFGAIVVYRKRDSFDQATMLMMLTLFFTVWFFKSENRFRVPFDAILISWGSVGFAWLLESLKTIISSSKQISVRSKAVGLIDQ